MNTFQQFFEDFNNWRKPVNAVTSDRNATWSGPEPAGFKGAEGLSRSGSTGGISVKLPTETSPKNRHKPRDRKLRQKKLMSAYKRDKRIEQLSQDT